MSKIAYGAWWRDGKWQGHCTKAPGELVACDNWPDWLTPDMLPVPRFRVNQRIRFSWGENKYLQGTIDEITIFFGSKPIRVEGWSRPVHYDVSEIAHRRSVYDYGNDDITAIGVDHDRPSRT